MIDCGEPGYGQGKKDEPEIEGSTERTESPPVSIFIVNSGAGTEGDGTLRASSGTTTSRELRKKLRVKGSLGGSTASL